MPLQHTFLTINGIKYVNSTSCVHRQGPDVIFVFAQDLIMSSSLSLHVLGRPWRSQSPATCWWKRANQGCPAVTDSSAKFPPKKSAMTPCSWVSCCGSFTSDEPLKELWSSVQLTVSQFYISTNWGRNFNNWVEKYNRGEALDVPWLENDVVD